MFQHKRIDSGQLTAHMLQPTPITRLGRTFGKHKSGPGLIGLEVSVHLHPVSMRRLGRHAKCFELELIKLFHSHLGQVRTNLIKPKPSS